VTAGGPRISVVIPVYNGAEFLRDAIDSALAQTWPDVEVIVVDDGSADLGATAAIVRSYGDRVRFIAKDHGGVSSALNAGIGAMTGDLFAWLSHDDIYYPRKLELQVAALRSVGGDAIVYSDYELVGPDLAPIKRKVLPDVPPAGFRIWLMSDSALHGCTVLVPRGFLADEPFDERLSTTQDYDMWFRLARDHRFVRVPEILLKYRIHALQESWTNPKRVEEGDRLLIGFLDAIGPAEIRGATDVSPSVVYLRAAVRFKLRGYRDAAAHARTLSGRVVGSPAERLAPARIAALVAYQLASPRLRPMYWWKRVHLRAAPGPSAIGDDHRGRCGYRVAPARRRDAAGSRGGAVSDDRQRVLVLGGTGMLGHTVFQHLSDRGDLDVHATARDAAPLEARTSLERRAAIHPGVDASRFETVERVVGEVRPNLLLNGIGIVRQVPASSDPVATMQINARLPHRLARLCAGAGVRLVHVSTDCVFSGARGNYTEADPPDPTDLYGRSKLLGEPGEGALTLRTSLIGHELATRHGLLEWLLAQDGAASGYRRAIFSGLTTLEFSRVLAEVVLPHPELMGVHHLSATPISKFELLRLIATRYGVPVDILPSEAPEIDRSLDSSRFRTATGYGPPTWPQLVDAMHADAVLRYGSRVGVRAPVPG
jgi:dTDP-4-dehydrorhamnose reductase